ncbi:MAG: hypothetical protein R3F55_19555 [Alphaproteobacteria bacterium]
MTATAAALEAGLDEVSSFIVDVRSRLIEGELVDLTGIDGKVIGLCANIAELPAGERAGFQSQLAILLRDLKQISNFLIEQSAAIGEAMEGEQAEAAAQPTPAAGNEG